MRHGDPGAERDEQRRTRASPGTQCRLCQAARSYVVTEHDGQSDLVREQRAQWYVPPAEVGGAYGDTIFLVDDAGYDDTDRTGQPVGGGPALSDAGRHRVAQGSNDRCRPIGT